MGRPIKKRFFVQGGGVDASAVVKAEGVTIAIANTGSHYSQGATVTLSAPNVTPGVQATANLTIASGAGGITAATIANIGEGYTSAPTATINTASQVLSPVTSGVTATNTFTVASSAGIYLGMEIWGAATGVGGFVTAINGDIITSSVVNNSSWNTTTSNLRFIDIGAGATFTLGLTHAEDDTNTIKAFAYVTGGSSGVTSAIIKQEGFNSYLVENNQGRSRCKLIATTVLTPGTMNIYATDANGSTYYVTKLTSRKAYLTQKTVNGSFLYTTGSVARWTTGAASVGTVSVTAN